MLEVNVTRALVLSQVVLCVALPFAILNIRHYFSEVGFCRWYVYGEEGSHGALVNRLSTTVAACAIAAVVILLNLTLLIQLISA